jgi:hypothetical protein
VGGVVGFRLTALPDYCRKYDLEPVIVDGFWTRGVDFPGKPIVSIDHHTAGPLVGYLPSLSTLINGRGGANPLAGPLCNGAAPRSDPGDNKIYLVASGKANHAGTGYWMGAKGNYDTVGLERELVGNGSDLTPWRNEISIRWHAAVTELLGTTAGHVARHAEFALPPGRKPDTAGVNGDWIRLLSHDRRYPGVKLPPPTTRKKTMDVITAPDGKRVDLVVIAPSHEVFHYHAASRAALKDAGGENLGVYLKSVTHGWVNEGTDASPVWTYFVEGQGQDDRCYMNVYNSTAGQWSGWINSPLAAMLLP